MRWWTRWRRRKERRERDLDREIRAHLELETEEQAAAGVPRSEAPYAARRAFGNVSVIQEVTRDMWGWTSLDRLSQDLRYATRILRKSPGFTTVAVVSLALGIGANTAIFTLINAVMLRNLPVHDPAGLVQLLSVHGLEKYNSFSAPEFRRLRDRASFFSGVFAWSTRLLQMTRNGDMEPVEGTLASGNYYPTLSLRAFIGRTLVPEDDRPGGGASGPVAVISYTCWERRFNRDPAVLGKTIVVEKVPFTIVGVTPRGFAGLEVGRAPEFTIPLSLQPQLEPDNSRLGENPQSRWLQLMARLQPGVTEEQAGARLQVLWPQLRQELVSWPGGSEGRQFLMRLGIGITSGGTGISMFRDQFARPLLVLMTVVGLVLLIACANVANLLLARAANRQREIALRLAIGAGRLRILRQLLTESLVLAFTGSVLGLLFAQWSIQVLAGFLSIDGSPASLNLFPDGPVLAFTAALGALTAVLFGLAPALRITHADPNAALKEGARSVSGAGWSLGKGLVVSQVALSLLLLIGAGLFVGSLRNLLTLDPGFEREGVLLANINPGKHGYRGVQLATVYKQLLERVRGLRTVSAASMSLMSPITGGGGVTLPVTAADGYVPAPGEDGTAFVNAVAPQYFATLGTPLLNGREFSAQDSAGAKVAIIDQSAARHYFADRDPVGRHITIAKQTREIVGVVKDAKYETLREQSHRTVYLPLFENPETWDVVLAVRTGEKNQAGVLTSLIRHEVRAFGSDIPVETYTLSDAVNETLTQERLVALLSSFFGLLALLLVSVGLYGVMSYTVTRRTAEIGIRMAVGADTRNVRWMVMKETLFLVALGLLPGLLASLVVTRLIASQLFGVSPTDWLTLSSATVFLVAVAALAGYLPARRASRIDPMLALRHE